MEKSFLHIKVISIYLLISAVCRISYSCSGFPGQGYTYPTGDILIEYNTSTPLEITCVITNKTLMKRFPDISSQLYFKKDNTYVPSEKIKRLNESSVMLVEENPEMMSSFYSCMLNERAVCLNNVAVGTKPQPVTDFSCIGHNYENLTCLWTPSKNYVATNYTLSYTFPKARAGKRPTDCNVTIDSSTGKWKCFLGLNTTPHYRQVQLFYNFTLKSTNRFGSLEQVFPFEHYKNILAGPPENLSCISSTVSSLFLRWYVPNALVPFEPGLQHRILYQCKFGPKVWQNGGLIKTKEAPIVTFNLTGLKYAHDVCDIRVAIRVQSSDSENMWSTNSSITALTSSTIPGAPPRVNVGSFQFDITTNLREIYVYWQQIPIEIRNAENFHYIVSVNGNSNIKPTEITPSYARFSNMSLYTAFKFTVRSNNSEGASEKSTELVVPANDDLIDEPVLFTKVAFDNGLYKLSWEQPKRGAEYVENYTLFWCSNEKDRPYQCTGYLNWTMVPADTREYNITVQEEYITQFAISANNATSSSGMVWATCTVIHNKHISKIKEVWISRVGSTFIELGWKLDCADRSDSVAGYIIYYCPRAKGPACSKPLQSVVISNPHAESGEVTGLTPYTTYMLTVSVKNKQGSESPESDPLFNTTYEDVPTEPYGLEEVLVTNSTIIVSWKPPIRINGHLKFYSIYFNNNSTATFNNQTKYSLDNLQSGTVYNISVSACTTLCSKKSNPILIRTKIGYPSKISTVWTKLENTSLVLQWIKPDAITSDGYYEVRRLHKLPTGNKTLPIVNVTDIKYHLLDCKEDDEYDNYYVAVRAANRDGKTLYTSPWSEDVEVWCNEKRTSSSVYWILSSVAVAGLLAFFALTGKRLYVHLTEMKTIDVKLPPGLDPQIDTSWTQPKPHTNPSDEERLLNSKSSTPQCVDSSGCSSGQGSVSLDSGGSSINTTSDSGTEHPKSTDDGEPNGLLVGDGANRGTSHPSYVQFSEKSTTPSWNSGNGYSMYGVTDASDGGTEIELADVETPYTTCDQVKEAMEEAETSAGVSNSSYVPLSNNAQQDKNPPYIMAANKTPDLFYRAPPNASQSGSEDKAYVQVADANVAKNGYVSFGGETPKVRENHGEDVVTTNNNKANGYVSIGDPPTKDDIMHSPNGYVSFGEAPQVTNSSYIPHRI